MLRLTPLPQLSAFYLASMPTDMDLSANALQWSLQLITGYTQESKSCVRYQSWRRWTSWSRYNRTSTSFYCFTLRYTFYTYLCVSMLVWYDFSGSWPYWPLYPSTYLICPWNSDGPHRDTFQMSDISPSRSHEWESRASNIPTIGPGSLTSNSIVVTEGSDRPSPNTSSIPGPIKHGTTRISNSMLESKRLSSLGNLEPRQFCLTQCPLLRVSWGSFRRNNKSLICEE